MGRKKKFMYIRIKDKGLRLLGQIKNYSMSEESITNNVVEVIKSIYYMKENLSGHIYAVYQHIQTGKYTD